MILSEFEVTQETTQTPPADTLLAIAHLVKPHGVRGAISAIPLAPGILHPSELVEPGRRFFLRDAAGRVKEVTAEGARPNNDRWIVMLEGYASIDDANLLRATDLCLPRNELPELPEGWYWEDDLQQCRVIDATRGELGKVKALNPSFPHALLRIDRPDGRVLDLPWLKAFVKQVDLEGKTIQIDLPQGIPGLDDANPDDKP